MCWQHLLSCTSLIGLLHKVSCITLELPSTYLPIQIRNGGVRMDESFQCCLANDVWFQLAVVAGSILHRGTVLDTPIIDARLEQL